MKFLFIFFFLLIHSNQSHARPISNVIRIATDGAYKPFTYVENGNLTGFDIDLSKEICRRLHRRCVFRYEGLSFGDLLPGLKKNRWDLAIAGMGITEERLVEYDFAGPYYRASKFFFGKKTNPLTFFPDDLAGRSVGVQDQTVRVAFMEFVRTLLEKSGKNVTVRVFPNIESIQKALLSGEIDFSIEDTGALEVLSKDPAFANYASTGPELSTGPGGRLFGVGDGIGVKKGNPLQFQINQALQSMFYDCSYAKIEARYFRNRNPLVPTHCYGH